MTATTKTAIAEACDSFFYTLADLTGGTHAEVVKQAPHGLERLTVLAGVVSEMLTRPGKRLLDDSWLMERAMSVASRLEKYRETWYAESQRPAPAPVAPPANVVPFALSATPEPASEVVPVWIKEAIEAGDMAPGSTASNWQSTFSRPSEKPRHYTQQSMCFAETDLFTLR